MNIAEVYQKGQVTFMGIEISVAPGTLVPREETELLGFTAIAQLEAMSIESPTIIDMCCGSGNLACALATRFPRAQVWACDLEDSCIHLARQNVQRLGLDGQVRVVQGDLFASLAGVGLDGRVDVIVCAPPYISQAKLAGESAELLAHEPRAAFDAGPYGLSIHQRVVRECVPFLRPGGVMLFEVGHGQEGQVKRLFTRAKSFDEAASVADAAGDPRVVYARRKTD